MTSWDLPDPFVIAFDVGDDEIDDYNHVNNAVYLTWCERSAWAHSAALGMPKPRCLALDRGMANVRTTVRYEKPALRGDDIEIATWLLTPIVRLRATRRFQVRRASDGVTLARMEIEYVCLELSSGRAVRAPAEFQEAYVALPAVLAAAEGLAAL